MFLDNLFSKISSLRAVIALIVAVTSLSFAPILIRIVEYDLGPYGTIFNRFAIAGIALVLGDWIVSLWQQKEKDISTAKQPYTLTDISSLVLLGLLESACHVTWAWSLTQTTVANSNLLHNTTPIFAALGGWLLFRQLFTRRFLLGMMLALVGTSAIAFQDLNLDPDTVLGDSVALLSAVFYAAALLLTEHLHGKFTTRKILIWNSILTALFVLPCVLIFEENIFPVSQSGWLAAISLGFLCTIIGVGALFYSLKHFQSSFVSLVLLLEPCLAALLAWGIFSEGLSLVNGLMFVVVLLGVYLAEPTAEFVEIGNDLTQVSD